MTALPDPLFEFEIQSSIGPHSYHVLQAVLGASLAEDLVSVVEGSYFSELTPREVIERGCDELAKFDGSACSPTDQEIQEAIDAEIDARIPRAWASKDDGPKQLDTQRSELAEIVASEVLERNFGTALPASRIRHKEIPDQPTRGADLVGIENAHEDLDCTLVLAEVKGSTDPKSPPGVVAGMVSKLKALVGDRRNLHQELIWVRDNCSGEYHSLLSAMSIQFALRKERFQILLCPVLLRARGVRAASDPGSFAVEPETFGHPVRWITVTIEDDLFDFAQGVYRLLRERGAGE